MSDPHYTPSGYPRRNRSGSSQFMRDELGLIERGIDEMDRYILSFEHRDAYNSETRYLVVPWDVTVARCGLVIHQIQSVSSLSVFWSNQSGATRIGLVDDENDELSIVNGAFEGSVIWSDTDGVDNSFDAGETIRSRTTSGDSATARATSIIELKMR